MDQIRQNFNNGMKLIKEMERIFEMWHKIEGYDNYSISSFGRVRNDTTNKILKQRVDNRGYYMIDLYYEPFKKKTLQVHSLIAKSFIPNPDNKECTDHIDRNRKNNFLGNLRWATRSENQQNRSIQSNNTSGIAGITYRKDRKIWMVRIWLKGKTISGGNFKDKNEAIQKRNELVEQYYGDFAPK